MQDVYVHSPADHVSVASAIGPSRCSMQNYINRPAHANVFKCESGNLKSEIRNSSFSFSVRKLISNFSEWGRREGEDHMELGNFREGVDLSIFPM